MLVPTATAAAAATAYRNVKPMCDGILLCVDCAHTVIWLQGGYKRLDIHTRQAMYHCMLIPVIGITHAWVIVANDSSVA